MSITLNPYLHFNGNAEKAIRLYEKTLDAKLSGEIMRYGDAPNMPSSPEAKNYVMHAMLQVDGGILMIGDAMPGQPVTSGGNVQVLLDFSDKADLITKFNALAKTGTVTMPLSDTFWGAHFGTLTDEFGVMWMFHCTLKKS